jgi:hypothetical protein
MAVEHHNLDCRFSQVPTAADEFPRALRDAGELSGILEGAL